MDTLQKLREANVRRSIEWMGNAPIPSDLLFCAVELGGETGEALNVCKKMERVRLGVVGSKAALSDLIEELADVIICVDRVAACYDIDLATAVREKFNKTSEKYGLKEKL
jgi:NTP pyrophosphatase (non-canonical NTP hydrolase)